MKIKTIVATIIHTESQRQEEVRLTLFFTDENEKYVITKVFAAELMKEVTFDSETNEILIPD